MATLVVRASGEPEDYLSWVTFTELAVTGASMIPQTLRLRHLGSSRFIVANSHIPFLALHVSGPGMPGSLVVVCTLPQSVLTLRVASLGRIFRQLLLWVYL